MLYLFLFIFILVLIANFIVINRLWLKKKTAENDIAIVRSEKNKTVLQVKRMEEQLKKEKLEKYDALLGSHFKSQQIAEMDNELKALKNEQQQFKSLIDEYADKLNENKQRQLQGIVFQTAIPNHTSILNDMYELIKKRIKNNSEQNEYFELLTTIDDAFFQRLKESAKRDKLSALEIKRCVAFLIGMKVSQIADCFSVETRSIHQAHYRLKVKLKLDKETDLTTFLKQLFLLELKRDTSCL